MEAIKKYPDDKVPNRWTNIAAMVGNSKSPSQCFQHWHRVLNPDINKGPWSIEEEVSLLSLVDGGHSSWSYIASLLNKRTDIQCRYQYNKLEK